MVHTYVQINLCATFTPYIAMGGDLGVRLPLCCRRNIPSDDVGRCTAQLMTQLARCVPSSTAGPDLMYVLFCYVSAVCVQTCTVAFSSSVQALHGLCLADWACSRHASVKEFSRQQGGDMS